MVSPLVNSKKIGFLSFGHYGRSAGSRTQDAGESLRQAIELSVAAEEQGVAGAFFRVHHFARQGAAPFPLLAAIAARTSTLEMGTGVIDMRYENPLYLAEEAAATDLISQGRLQLGVSRGSPEPALNGASHFGYVPGEGETSADMARRHTELFREAISGAGIAPADLGGGRPGLLLPIEPQAPGLDRRIWWGAGTRATAIWAAEQGMNLMSSTLLTEDTGVPFDQLQAEQIRVYRQAWKDAGHDWTPRVSVSRSIIPLVSEEDHHYFGLRGQVEGKDQVGLLEGTLSRFGRSYIGEPDKLAGELARDEAVQEADTVLVTVPNQLGVNYNAALLGNVVRHVFG
ncbi:MULTISPECIES: LLM class flavin-dependent oxidoreductase [Arthrobacter]|uniref:LLM class flavin-dependent oxidoreductase n=2 Tax=Arthrobacter TaxID=1663 RepID=A0ABU9KMD6_9MICC|nr:LLM class flavin-dependent oxidoreductase [Arthrobacter sp. YJM1]MDP5228010.1 LLM class flavin-dependent oxidoreductase [Arthrobacter sp. YJM1]